MTTKESIEQLKSLIEHFNNGGNDFNATDIEAIQFLLKENQELKGELELYENGVYFSSEVDEKDRLIDELKEKLDKYENPIKYFKYANKNVTEENKQLKDNWGKLKKWIVERQKQGLSVISADYILYKMIGIERGDSNE